MKCHDASFSDDSRLLASAGYDAVARVESRGILLLLDALHQVAAAIWVGGLAHLALYAVVERSEAPARAWQSPGARAESTGEARVPAPSADITQRFSRMALVSVATLTVAGIGLTIGYVGDLPAFVGTAYGVMIVSKVVLFVVALAFASANFRMARAAVGPGGRLGRYVEVELGLAITVLFAAASLTCAKIA